MTTTSTTLNSCFAEVHGSHIIFEQPQAVLGVRLGSGILGVWVKQGRTSRGALRGAVAEPEGLKVLAADAAAELQNGHCSRAEA